LWSPVNNDGLDNEDLEDDMREELVDAKDGLSYFDIFYHVQDSALLITTKPTKCT